MNNDRHAGLHAKSGFLDHEGEFGCILDRRSCMGISGPMHTPQMRVKPAVKVGRCFGNIFTWKTQCKAWCGVVGARRFVSSCPCANANIQHCMYLLPRQLLLAHLNRCEPTTNLHLFSPGKIQNLQTFNPKTDE